MKVVGRRRCGLRARRSHARLVDRSRAARGPRGGREGGAGSRRGPQGRQDRADSGGGIRVDVPSMSTKVYNNVNHSCHNRSSTRPRLPHHDPKPHQPRHAQLVPGCRPHQVAVEDRRRPAGESVWRVDRTQVGAVGLEDVVAELRPPASPASSPGFARGREFGLSTVNDASVTTTHPDPAAASRDQIVEVGLVVGDRRPLPPPTREHLTLLFGNSRRGSSCARPPMPSAAPPPARSAARRRRGPRRGGNRRRSRR